MKALTAQISMTIIAVAAMSAAGAASGAPALACGTSNLAYPTFCSIPAAPRNVKSPAAVHAEVLDTRLAGRAVVLATVPSTFTLDDTTGFAGRATTEAAPPPPLTTPSEADPTAFAKATRATAIPPKHPR